MRSHITKITLLAFLGLARVVFLPGLLAQNGDYVAELYGIEKGISDRVVHDLALDSLGFLWVCEQRATQLWDGNSFTHLNELFPEMPRECPCAEMWYTEKLIFQSYTNPSEFHFLNPRTKAYRRTEISDQFVLQKEQNYPLWIHSARDSIEVKLYVNELKDFSTDRSLLKGVVIATSMPDDLIFLLDEFYNYGVFNHQGEKIKEGHLSRSDQLSAPHQVISTSEGDLWFSILGGNWIYSIDLETNEINRNEDSKSRTPIKLMFADDNNQLLYTASNRDLYNQEAYLVKRDGTIKALNDLIKTEENFGSLSSSNFSENIWVASYNGLWFQSHQAPPVLPLYQRPGKNTALNGFIVRDITGNDSTIFLTKESRFTEPFYFLKDNPENVRGIHSNPVTEYQCNRNLSITTDNILYRSGCSLNNGGRLERYDLNKKAYHVKELPYVPEAMELKGRTLFIGTVDRRGDLKSHLLSYNIDTHEYEDLILNGLPDQALIRHIDVEENIIHLGTTEGVYQYSLQEKSVQALLEDKIGGVITFIEQYENELFVGADNQGLFIYNLDSEELTQISEKDGLKNKSVAIAYPMSPTTIFIATFNGLHIVDREYGVLQILQTDHGLSHDEFNRFSYHIDQDTMVYLGTMNGVTRIDVPMILNDVKASTMVSYIDAYYSKPDTTHRDIVLNNLMNSVYEIDDGFSTLTIHLSLTNSNYIDLAKYLVRVKGYDDHWRLIEGNNLTLFSDLQPGDYNIEIIGIDNFGNRATPAHLSISVKQLWYNSLLLKLLILFFLLGLIALWVRRYIKSVKEREASKTATNKKMMELELIAFRSQMNPHFIFNALGSIQYFIQTADTESADDYLTKFGKLMRRFLEASKASYTSLNDELDLLKHYLDLEKLRGEGRFDYKISIDKDVSAGDVYIPSMILQPFIENAIIHGIGPLQGREGMIILDIAPSDDELIIKIDDNGIGRAAALARSAKSHASRGLGIVNDRINSLNQQGDHEIHIKILDKMDDDQQAQGTTVVLTIKDKLSDHD